MSEYKPQAGDRVEITLTALIEKLHAAPASQE